MGSASEGVRRVTCPKSLLEDTQYCSIAEGLQRPSLSLSCFSHRVSRPPHNRTLYRRITVSLAIFGTDGEPTAENVGSDHKMGDRDKNVKVKDRRGSDELGLCDELLRKVGQAFYTDAESVIIELLLRKGELIENKNTPNALQEQTGLSNKLVRKHLQILKRDSIVSTEDFKGNTYFYIDKQHFFYSMLYRMTVMEARLEKIVSATQTGIRYHCPKNEHREKTYSELEVIPHMSNGQFLCPLPNCGEELVVAGANRGEKHRSSLTDKLAPQVRRLKDLFKELLYVKLDSNIPSQRLAREAEIDSKRLETSGATGETSEKPGSAKGGKKRSRDDLSDTSLHKRSKSCPAHFQGSGIRKNSSKSGANSDASSKKKEEAEIAKQEAETAKANAEKEEERKEEREKSEKEAYEILSQEGIGENLSSSDENEDDY